MLPGFSHTNVGPTYITYAICRHIGARVRELELYLKKQNKHKCDDCTDKWEPKSSDAFRKIHRKENRTKSDVVYAVVIPI